MSEHKPIWPPRIYIDTEDGEWYPTEFFMTCIPYKRTSFRFVTDNPEADIVWLEPGCSQCDGAERTYCEDDIYDLCPGDGCNKRAWPYRRET